MCVCVCVATDFLFAFISFPIFEGKCIKNYPLYIHLYIYNYSQAVMKYLAMVYVSVFVSIYKDLLGILAVYVYALICIVPIRLSSLPTDTSTFPVTSFLKIIATDSFG